MWMATEGHYSDNKRVEMEQRRGIPYQSRRQLARQ